jgi:hypothetical protein
MFTKTAWYWPKTDVNQDNRIETKKPKTYTEKNTLLNKWWWENWVVTCRRLKLDSYSYHVKNNSKWIKDLNVKPETLKVLQENAGKILEDIDTGL